MYKKYRILVDGRDSEGKRYRVGTIEINALSWEDAVRYGMKRASAGMVEKALWLVRG